MSERREPSKTVFNFLLTFMQTSSFFLSLIQVGKAGNELIKNTKLQQGTSAVCVNNYSWWDSLI